MTPRGALNTWALGRVASGCRHRSPATYHTSPGLRHRVDSRVRGSPRRAARTDSQCRPPWVQAPCNRIRLAGAGSTPRPLGASRLPAGRSKAVAILFPLLRVLPGPLPAFTARAPIPARAARSAARGKREENQQASKALGLLPTPDPAREGSRCGAPQRDAAPARDLEHELIVPGLDDAPQEQCLEFALVLTRPHCAE